MPTPSPTPTPSPAPTFSANPPCSGEGVGTVQFVYRVKQCKGQPQDTYPDTYTSDVTVGPGGAVETFTDTALACWDTTGGGNPTNRSVLDTLAQTFAYDWMNWRQQQFDEVIIGVAAVVPTGLYESIEWDLDSRRHATRLYSSPHNFRVQQLGHFDWPDDQNCTDADMETPCAVYYGPPGQCVGGQLQLTRWQLCLEDGRLVQRYVSTDTIE